MSRGTRWFGVRIVHVLWRVLCQNILNLFETYILPLNATVYCRVHSMDSF